MNSLWKASLIGTGGTAVALFILLGFSNDFFAIREIHGTPWEATLWFVVLGFVVAALAAAGAWYHWLVSAIPAIVLLGVHLPVLPEWMVPGWYPGWIDVDAFVKSTSPAVFVIVGVFAAASVWPMIRSRRDSGAGAAEVESAE